MKALRCSRGLAVTVRSCSHSRDFRTVHDAEAFFRERPPPRGRCQEEAGWAEAPGGEAAAEMYMEKHRGKQLPREKMSLLPMPAACFLPVPSYCISLLGLPRQSIRYWVSYITEMCWKSEIRSQQGRLPLRLLSLAWRRLSSACVFTWSSLCAWPCPDLIFLKAHQSYWIRVHPNALILNLITSLKALSPNLSHCKVLGVRTSTYKFGEQGRHNSAHNSY